MPPGSCPRRFQIGLSLRGSTVSSYSPHSLHQLGSWWRPAAWLDTADAFLRHRIAFVVFARHQRGSDRLVVQMTISADSLEPLAGPHPELQDPDRTYVWYASYASNMCTPRFMCYIQGGQAEGMAKPSCGGRDKTPPLASRWTLVPHDLFFGRDLCYTWGAGGVAFLDPHPHESLPTTLIRMYKITWRQFCDVLAQENCMDPNDSKLIFEWGRINELRNELTAPAGRTFDFLPGAWYGAIRYLGDEDGLPILTITCSAADVKRYKERQLPVCAPSESYCQVIMKGLLEYGFSEEEARSYVLSRAPTTGGH